MIRCPHKLLRVYNILAPKNILCIFKIVQIYEALKESPTPFRAPKASTEKFTAMSLAEFISL